MEEAKTSQGLESRAAWRLETNLITFSSNVLKVYALPSEDSTTIDLRLSTQFNGRILDVLCVPTEPFLKDEFGFHSADPKKRKGAEGANQPSAREVRTNRRKNRDIEHHMIDTTEAAVTKEPAAETENNDHADQQQQLESPDYLFVILSNFNVALVCYSKKDHKIEVVSRGNISEKILHDQKDPPYPIFLGQTGTFIVLMLYHNILKVIPLVRAPETS